MRSTEKSFDQQPEELTLPSRIESFEDLPTSYYAEFVNRVNPEIDWDPEAPGEYCPPEHALTKHLVSIASTRSDHTQRARATSNYLFLRDFLLRNYDLPSPEFDDIAVMVIGASVCKKADLLNDKGKLTMSVTEEISELFQNQLTLVEDTRDATNALSEMLPHFALRREQGRLKMNIEERAIPKAMAPEIARRDRALVDLVLDRTEKTARSLWPYVFTRDALNAFLATSKKCRKNGPATLNARLSHLQSFEEDLILTDQLVNHKPATMQIKRPKIGQRYQPTLEQGDIEKILSYADYMRREHDTERGWLHWRNYAMLHTLDATLLRNTPVCTLLYEDVDIDEGKVYVRAEKGGKSRCLQLTEPAVDAIADYIPFRFNRLEEIGVHPKTFPFLFLSKSRSGKQVQYRDFERLIDDIAYRAGVPESLHGKYGPHSWRRGVSTQIYIDTDGDKEIVRTLLGHESSTTTDQYIRSGIERVSHKIHKDVHPRSRSKKGKDR